MRTPYLPQAYIQQINTLLADNAERFLRSYEEPRTQGLRINPLKSTVDSLLTAELKTRFQLEPVPWCETGFYYNEDQRPGKHPYHTAGMYYIQEPSAMSAVELLDPKPGEVILDLAGAPGGKSTHIAGKMQGQGLLIANEIHPQRAKILAENIERMGVTNALVTNATPDELAARFPVYFDRIMLDAPCSGEGMFRKDPDAVSEWSEDHVIMCATRQWDILEQAVTMLKPGGTLAYSTCTFNTLENEQTIDRLLAAFPEFALLRTERIWPHEHRGEGHFVAVLRKAHGDGVDARAALAAGEAPRPRDRRKAERAQRGKGQPAASVAAGMDLFLAWAREELPGFTPGKGEALLFGESLYELPQAGGSSLTAAQLSGLRIPRAGLHLGTIRKNRIEPAHALALAVKPEWARLVYDFAPEAPEIAAYLRGETLRVSPDDKGWALVTVDGLPLGWGKTSGGQLKNHYPKGLRQP
ncbi:RNA methyltransferase [Paenibacillus selenitireducens]|uniref:RNA methyltransferase n=1 Tax=Paenibacillus selenitireducens TaxID=1324314 RepID=A0A1T2XMW9_9BACL|nr:RsmB/NOP family class I SAM-dependent RNA methyltransferase [Paenibacillus selenitireducens]OPA81155.1 RNA methyltransferase [Paenibacillus selenitireducens]